MHLKRSIIMSLLQKVYSWDYVWFHVIFGGTEWEQVGSVVGKVGPPLYCNSFSVLMDDTAKLTFQHLTVEGKLKLFWSRLERNLPSYGDEGGNAVIWPTLCIKTWIWKEMLYSISGAKSTQNSWRETRNCRACTELRETLLGFGVTQKQPSLWLWFILLLTKSTQFNFGKWMTDSKADLISVSPEKTLSFW